MLFAGQEILSRIFTEAIAAAPPNRPPRSRRSAAALAATEAAFDADRRASARKIQQVVAGHADLHERELLKRAKLRSAMADALRTRGVPDPTANLAAEIGGMAFTTAFASWVAPANERAFGELAQEALEELVKAAGALS